MPDSCGDLPPFLRLHPEQAATTLCHVVWPPRERGNRWSKVNSSRAPQYWQTKRSRRNTLNRVKAGLRDGFVLVSAMHITASVFVNDHEAGLWHDVMEWLEKLAPGGLDYRHHQTGEDNADAHLKRMLLGHQVLVPVTDGKLDLGPWERVHYGEFDGRRPKRVLFKALGE